jgi:hypothetical protein
MFSAASLISKGSTDQINKIAACVVVFKIKKAAKCFAPSAAFFIPF